MFHHITHSFAAKLNLYILFSFLVLGGIGFMVFHHYAVRYIEKQTYLQLNESAEKTNLKVSRLLYTIEKIAENLSWMISTHVAEPDSIFAITRQVVRHNVEIFGCAIAFEPHYFPGKGHYFAPYSYTRGDSVITTEIDRQYDYYHKTWYKIAKDLNISRWCRPYHDLSDQDIVTTTYSVPLHDSSERVIGIFSVDLCMNWLSTLIDSATLYDDSYNIIVNQEGRYILRSGEKTIFYENGNNVLETVKSMEDPTALGIAREMIGGKKGKGLFFNKGTLFYIYYAPLNGTEWSIATIFPYSHIFQGLHRFKLLLITYSLLFAGLIILINSLTIRKITKPLQLFASSSRAIAEGNFNAPLPQITTQDEMQDLYDAFKEMQEKLTDYLVHLEQTTAAKEKIESELKIAHDIQMSMLPKSYPPFPGRKELDLYAILFPARQVGGDLYDYFIKDECLYFTIGDVSGKGIPASLLMASTISLLRTLSSNIDSPARIANLLNRSIAKRNEADMFVTLFVGILNLHSGSMKYCNAGHTLPILTSPNRKVSIMEIQSDIPLGILEEHHYQEYVYRFDKGSGILLYTDGVTDAENLRHEFYTKERLISVIQKHPDLHPKEFIQTILHDIQQHRSGQALSDDLSMLTFIYGTEWNIKNE